MRDEVDGHAYVEHHVQHMTHEMKKPRSPFIAAPQAARRAIFYKRSLQRFASGEQAQSERLQALIDKLLRLAQLGPSGNWSRARRSRSRRSSQTSMPHWRLSPNGGVALNKRASRRPRVCITVNGDRFL